MVKFKNLDNGEIIEVNNEKRISKLKGYPDKFVICEENKEIKNEDENNLSFNNSKKSENKKTK